MHRRAAMVVTLAVAFWTPLGDAAVVVDDPWIRAGPPTAMVLAGYMKLRNDAVRRSLVGAESRDFQRIVLHQTVVKGGVTTMHYQSRIDLFPGAELDFAPSGLHLMLMEPRRVLRAGDRVNVELLFGDGSRMSVTFVVRDRAGEE